MRSSYIILSYILTFAFLQGMGQKLDFESLTDKDGLVNSDVSSILKDSHGYMWIGTFNGLSKYDGYHFTNYNHDPKNNNTINDTRVRCLYESKDSTLIVGFDYAGIATYNRETETFTRFRHDSLNPNSLVDDHIFSLSGDRKGNIWVGTKFGLDKFDPKTKTFRHYNPLGKSRFSVLAISEDKNGNLWFYINGDQVFKFDPVTSTFKSFTIIENYHADIAYSDLICDSKGYLWIGTDGYGLCKFNTQTGEKEWFNVQNKMLNSNYIFSLIEDGSGVIWIGTDGAGIYRCFPGKDSLVQTAHNPNESTSLSGNGVYCLYESDPGTIWIGVYGAGLSIYKRDKNKFIKYTSFGSPGYCLNNKSVLSIAEAADGKIWLGTDGGGLNLLDPLTYSFKYFTKENSIICANVIKSIFVGKDKNLWLGSYANGLCKVNFDKNEVQNYRGEVVPGLKDIHINHVWAIQESFDKKIWLGLISYGINVYDPVKNKFEFRPFDKDAFIKGLCNINTVFEDSHKRMWVGSERQGLAYFDPQKQAYTCFRYDEKNPKGLPSNIIRGVFEDSHKNIWVATYKGGLSKITDIEKGEFETYTKQDGLTTNNIQNILEDDHGNLWLSSDKGIILFNVKEKKFLNFDLEDGLQGKEFNFNSALKAKNGYMYFGGLQGLNAFHPDSIRFNTKAPKVILTEFKIFDKALQPNEVYNNRVYLPKAISLLDEVTLTHEDIVFSIDFAALDFTAPHKNKYAYRLVGFNNRWTYVNADKRTANYTNLDPGEYILQVIASNNDGVWNKIGTSLKIIILPPWWKTWWFRTLMAVFILISMAAVYYIRLRSIQQKNKDLEKEVKKRTKELEEANVQMATINQEILDQQIEIIAQKNELENKKLELEHLNKTKDKFFSIIGHDLKGPVRALTSITGMLRDESESMTNAKHKLLINHADSTSVKIQNLVLNLLEWARTQSRQVKIEPVPIAVTDLFRENIELLSEQASQKEITIKHDTINEHTIFGDYNMICTVVRNILSNSIKYTPRGGMITLSSSLSDGEVKLSITDNGVGMSEEILNNLFTLEKKTSEKGTEKETGTGLGMIIAREFVELNKGRIFAESVIGKGSSFYLVLPVA